MKYYKYRQGDHENNAKHSKNFKDIVEVIEHPGGNIVVETELLRMKEIKILMKASQE